MDDVSLSSVGKRLHKLLLLKMLQKFRCRRHSSCSPCRQVHSNGGTVETRICTRLLCIRRGNITIRLWCFTPDSPAYNQCVAINDKFRSVQSPTYLLLAKNSSGTSSLRLQWSFDLLWIFVSDFSAPVTFNTLLRTFPPAKHYFFMTTLYCCQH